MERLKWGMVVLCVLTMSFGGIYSCGGGGGGGGSAAEATVSGTILDSNSDPIAGALVTIQSDIVITYTLANGDFTVDVEVGDHTITVTYGGSTVYEGNFAVSDESPVDLGDLDPTTPGVVWYKDADEDLYSDGTSVYSGSAPADYYSTSTLTTVTGDCDDDDDSINPGEMDVCGDGIDSDCDNVDCILNNAAVAGTFLVGELGVDLDPVGGWCQALEVYSDGAGGLAFSTIASSAGDAGAGTGSYSVAADGVLTIGSEADETLTGQISLNAEYFAFADANTAGDDISMTFGVLRSTGMSDAAFAGTYIAGQIGIGDGSNSWAKEVLFEAYGDGTFYYEDLSAGGDTGSGTYSVADDGTVSIIGQTDAHAQLSPDGSIFLFVDTSNDYAHLAVGIRQSSGMSDSDFSGTYHSGIMEFFDTADLSSGAMGRADLTADGNGIVEYTVLESSDGEAGSGSITSFVAGDGSITFDGEWPGQLSSDGSLFTFIQQDEYDYCHLLIGIRKP